MIPHSTVKTNHNMMCVLVRAQSNQPEACASLLGDDQLRYLLFQCFISHVTTSETEI